MKDFLCSVKKLINQKGKPFAEIQSSKNNFTENAIIIKSILDDDYGRGKIFVENDNNEELVKNICIKKESIEIEDNFNITVTRTDENTNVPNSIKENSSSTENESNQFFEAINIQIANFITNNENTSFESLENIYNPVGKRIISPKKKECIIEVLKSQADTEISNQDFSNTFLCTSNKITNGLPISNNDCTKNNSLKKLKKTNKVSFNLNRNKYYESNCNEINLKSKLSLNDLNNTSINISTINKNNESSINKDIPTNNDCSAMNNDFSTINNNDQHHFDAAFPLINSCSVLVYREPDDTFKNMGTLVSDYEDEVKNVHDNIQNEFSLPNNCSSCYALDLMHINELLQNLSLDTTNKNAPRMAFIDLKPMTPFQRDDNIVITHVDNCTIVTNKKGNLKSYRRKKSSQKVISKINNLSKSKQHLSDSIKVKYNDLIMKKKSFDTVGLKKKYISPSTPLKETLEKITENVESEMKITCNKMLLKLQRNVDFLFNRKKRMLQTALIRKIQKKREVKRKILISQTTQTENDDTDRKISTNIPNEIVESIVLSDSCYSNEEDTGPNDDRNTEKDNSLILKTQSNDNTKKQITLSQYFKKFNVSNKKTVDAISYCEVVIDQDLPNSQDKNVNVMDNGICFLDPIQYIKTNSHVFCDKTNALAAPITTVNSKNEIKINQQKMYTKNYLNDENSKSQSVANRLLKFYNVDPIMKAKYKITNKRASSKIKNHTKDAINVEKTLIKNDPKNDYNFDESDDEYLTQNRINKFIKSTKSLQFVNDKDIESKFNNMYDIPQIYEKCHASEHFKLAAENNFRYRYTSSVRDSQDCQEIIVSSPGLSPI